MNIRLAGRGDAFGFLKNSRIDSCRVSPPRFVRVSRSWETPSTGRAKGSRAAERRRQVSVFFMIRVTLGRLNEDAKERYHALTDLKSSIYRNFKKYHG